MRQNRFAVTELELPHSAIGLCQAHPCGLLLCLSSCSQMQQIGNLQSWENQFQTRVHHQSSIAYYNICFSLKEIIFKLNPLNYSLVEVLPKNHMAGTSTIFQEKTIQYIYVIESICATWYSAFRKQQKFLVTEPIYSRKELPCNFVGLV